MDKNLIVHTARNLFYEQGIENVTVKKIAETCGTATSLINYHFQSKANLVVNVVEQYSHEIDEVVKDMIYKCRVQYDVLVCNLLSLCVKLDMYAADEKARNFYLEYLNLGFDTLFSASYEDLYTQIDRSVILDLDPTYNQLPSVSAAAHGALLSLMYAYFSKKRCLNMLAECPEWIKQKGLVKYSMFGSSAKGVSVNGALISTGIDLINDWLKKPVPVEVTDENGESMIETNALLYNIRNRALLQEMVSYAPEKNTDRVSALFQVMFYREQFNILYGGAGSEVQDVKDVSDDPFFEDAWKQYTSKFGDDYKSSFNL